MFVDERGQFLHARQSLTFRARPSHGFPHGLLERLDFGDHGYTLYLGTHCVNFVCWV
jgi:hypothetical protein